MNSIEKCRKMPNQFRRWYVASIPTQVAQALESVFHHRPVHRRNTISNRVFPRFSRKRAGGDNDAFIGSTHHSPSEVTNLHARNAPLIFFAPKQHFETHERVDLQDSDAIDVVTVPR
jgi:hypothetical protein